MWYTDDEPCKRLNQSAYDSREFDDIEGKIV